MKQILDFIKKFIIKIVIILYEILRTEIYFLFSPLRFANEYIQGNSNKKTNPIYFLLFASIIIEIIMRAKTEGGENITKILQRDMTVFGLLFSPEHTVNFIINYIYIFVLLMVLFFIMHTVFSIKRRPPISISINNSAYLFICYVNGAFLLLIDFIIILYINFILGIAFISSIVNNMKLVDFLPIFVSVNRDALRLYENILAGSILFTVCLYLIYNFCLIINIYKKPSWYRWVIFIFIFIFILYNIPLSSLVN